MTRPARPRRAGGRPAGPSGPAAGRSAKPGPATPAAARRGRNGPAGSGRGARLAVEVSVRPGLPVGAAGLGRSVLEAAARELGIGRGAVSLLFCGDGEIAVLNREFLGKRGPTDVLSFPSGESPGMDASCPERIPGRAARGRGSRRAAGGPMLGDIAVSLETASRQARRGERSLEREVATLLVHGLLHLLGHDHETDSGEMMRLQRRICRARALVEAARAGRIGARGRRSPSARFA